MLRRKSLHAQQLILSALGLSRRPNVLPRNTCMSAEHDMIMQCYSEHVIVQGPLVNGPAAHAAAVAPAVNNSGRSCRLCAGGRHLLVADTAMIITATWLVMFRRCAMHWQTYEQRGISKRSSLQSHVESSFAASAGAAAVVSGAQSACGFCGPSAGFCAGLLAAATPSLLIDPAMIVNV